MSKLLPRTDETHPLPYADTAQRVFRVTVREINQKTTLRLADSPEDAVEENRSQEIAPLDRQYIRETVECIELIAQGTAWRSLRPDGE